MKRISSVQYFKQKGDSIIYVAVHIVRHSSLRELIYGISYYPLSEILNLQVKIDEAKIAELTLINDIIS